MLKSIDAILFPVIRNVAPNIIAKQILGVPRITTPLGYPQPLPDVIRQLNPFVYQFYSSEHPEIFDWLLDGCVWNYTIWTDIGRNSLTRITSIRFDNIRGSIEFKVRF